MRFWDSSALVPLLVRHGATARMLALLRADPAIVAWWATRVECDSAVAWLERSAHLDVVQARRARSRLDRLASGWEEIQPVDALRDAARRMLRHHDLRAGDALQLAVALVAAEQRPSTLAFVCLDARLSVAADREGLPVVGV